MKRKYKFLLLGLCGACAIGLLSACYVAPDDVSSGGDVSTSVIPFQTLAPTATITPETIMIETAGPTDGTQAQNTDGSGGWTDWLNNGATPTPAASDGVIIFNTYSPSPSESPSESVKPTILVVTTAPPTSTPTPPSLQVGFKGSAEVRALQKRLKELGYYTGTVDGDFGKGTETAVKAFQKANGLTADGKAGEKTLAKLNSKNAVSKKAASASATPKKNTPKPTAKATATPRPTATPNLSKDYYLQKGASGKRVRTLQDRLITLGWLGGKATGDYDEATENAVKAFQRATRGLYEDGVAGPDTLRALYSAGAAKSSSVASSTGETLERGSEGYEVRRLQDRLKALGYAPGYSDGKYGATTEAAVMAFQSNNNLTVDGKAGPATQRKLYGTSAKSPVTYATLREGSTGDAVRNLQYTLYELGYYDGAIDGVYGATTSDAVRAFQISNGVQPVDGIAGNATLSKLYSSGAVPATVPYEQYETVRPGDQGDSVVQVQDCLVEFGYLELEQVTGIYDDTTTQAVRNFQAAWKLTVDGIAGPETLKILFGF